MACFPKKCATWLLERREISTNYCNVCPKYGNRQCGWNCELHSFCTSSNSCQHSSMLNGHIWNCYRTLSALLLCCSHLHAEFHGTICSSKFVLLHIVSWQQRTVHCNSLIPQTPVHSVQWHIAVKPLNVFCIMPDRPHTGHLGHI